MQPPRQPGTQANPFCYWVLQKDVAWRSSQHRDEGVTPE